MYATDALQIITENTGRAVKSGKSINKRFIEIIQPQKVDNRSADEIVQDVITRAGLEVI